VHTTLREAVASGLSPCGLVAGSSSGAAKAGIWEEWLVQQLFMRAQRIQSITRNGRILEGEQKAKAQKDWGRQRQWLCFGLGSSKALTGPSSLYGPQHLVHA
jgi:hypothetical protein